MREIMKLPIKMYLIIFISASVILYQYHLSNWLMSYHHSQNFNGKYIQDSFEKGVSYNSNPQQHSSNISTLVNSFCDGDHWNATEYFQCINLPPGSVKFNSNELPPLYIITPTYRRPEQLAELTRMSHTLMLVPNVHWLVIEDAIETTSLVTQLLRNTGLKFEHLTGRIVFKVSGNVIIVRYNL